MFVLVVLLAWVPCTRLGLIRKVSYVLIAAKTMLVRSLWLCPSVWGGSLDGGWRARVLAHARVCVCV